ncbi:flagellar basal-body rod protein FlgG [Thermosulfidibacter takaii ABI70S6]|uniref:Flagellar basal-body rod protein FlgG n=1 Tax=Thermosulfidibacter takaii (strain DSM 17441 / JCM 13301 / NBRC 103674 / ABI70S6) TaxID=1298851 RepID=A0A0S3QSU8_THET7|nr:flagellar hook-basal body protein [Thermosulfidibacter takaii]BAT71401.1 flagellar basal-body rod protein FlgG [Thermosulfidibacter takaii ABI70S6]
MVSSLYTAASGMIAEERRLDVVSNNLANIDTPGFKREGITFSNYLYYYGLVPGSAQSSQYFSEGSLPFVSQNSIAFPDEHYFDFSAGSLKPTDNPLDVAIDGRGFFVVRTPYGDMFTRNGSFKLGTDGVLRTSNGYEVLGRVTPNSPPEPIVVNPNQPLEITADGWVVQNGNRIFKLEIRDFNGDYNKSLEAFGYNLFRFKDPNSKGFLVDNPSLLVGYVETSNADVVREMVSLVNCLRHYEACQKAVQVTFEDVTGRTVNDVGAVG